jgi:DNA-binding transcriptional MerR regulator
MEYTVQKLGKLAGISTRTLRYYDEIGILKPARVTEAGYRIYGEEQVNRLQQILFYRELGCSLEMIREILQAPDFDELAALRQHRAQLMDRRKQLDALIRNVEMTIASKEGRITMSDKEKFEGFKKQLVEDNELQFGEEIRQKYGEEAVEHANKKLLNMTEEQYEEMKQLQVEFMKTLGAAHQTGDPAGELAQRAAELHRKWLGYYWKTYSKEAHAGLAQLYVDDERFAHFFADLQPGAAEFLRDAVRIYTGVQA